MTVALILLAVIFGAAGVAKVAGAQFTRDKFARWPIDERLRVRIGLVEIVLAVLALIGIASEPVAIVAALGVIVAMVIAFRIHLAAKDPIALTSGAPFAAALGVLVLVLAIV
ncbi:DoxX family protein [Patulibacter sp.]|uniref:DoxX family protein n=1 Tax=Patulibacter sp. TaxID=1912859 RepID=UPI00271900B6|nr:DoxX family protein [Patulibacter sp.]MDO9409464.1 DoxX family protein [Patulibacter sp.]